MIRAGEIRRIAFRGQAAGRDVERGAVFRPEQALGQGGQCFPWAGLLGGDFGTWHVIHVFDRYAEHEGSWGVSMTHAGRVVAGWAIWRWGLVGTLRFAGQWMGIP